MAEPVVLVTGASSGIGRACAERFAREGGRVIACARRADRIAGLEQAFPGRIQAEVLDVRDRDAASALVARLLDGYGAIDILVNAAGLGPGLDGLPEGDPDDWDTMLDTNVRGLLNVTQPTVAAMVARGAGHVINIGSIAGHEMYTKGAVYCATKAAVDRITRGLRMDILGTGVRVSSVDPGLVETEFALVRFRGDERKAARWYAGTVPLSGADVADAVYWVATRPAHVQIAQVAIYPTDQAAIRHLVRRPDEAADQAAEPAAGQS
jgi:3-hydroxy acid dehydrogenase / malonic semialdehyde reductase